MRAATTRRCARPSPRLRGDRARARASASESAGAAHDRLDVERVAGVEQREHRAIVTARACDVRPGPRSALRGGEPERDEHVERVAHRAAAVVDELVRALGRRAASPSPGTAITWRPRTIASRTVSIDPPAARGLDDHDEIGERGDQAIARGEPPRRRRRARRSLGEQHARARRQPPRARAFVRRIRARRARCRRRRSAARQSRVRRRAGVRRAVDAAREARHDRRRRPRRARGRAAAPSRGRAPWPTECR